MKNNEDNIKAGIIGHCTGDALGVPVEFLTRDELRLNPVEDMQGYGTYNLPAGTWSDDTSMTLCLLDSLANGLDYSDIMQKFRSWFNISAYTPRGQVFDVGSTCRKAIMRFVGGFEPLACGSASEGSNGNGSLMRILPLAFYLYTKYDGTFSDREDAFEIIHQVSALTHAHPRSQIACGIYLVIAENILSGQELHSAIYSGARKAKDYYRNSSAHSDELSHFDRIFDKAFADLPESEIGSGGYVLDTLEAALWCLLNTDQYKTCVLKAVNLGCDTDTTAAVAGGLAGLFYGYQSVPAEWISQLARVDYIESLCQRLAEACRDQ